jgi:hypothetical protein
LVTWGRAWRAAGAWFGWSLVCGFVGIIFIVAGALVISGSAVYSIYGGVNYLAGDMAGGIVLMVIGWFIIILGSMAAYFKISSEIIAQEVKKEVGTFGPTSQTPIPPPATTASAATPSCPTCGGSLRFVQQYQRWYCDKEGKYV